MSAQLTVLKTLADEDRESVVSVLEEALEAAKDGRYQAIAIACVGHDGTLFTEWSTVSNAGPVIGAISLLQHNFISGLKDLNGG